jgi:hypothetical protein
VLDAEHAVPGELWAWWGWCLSAQGRERAQDTRRLMRGRGPGRDLLAELLAELTGPQRAGS